MNSSFDNIELFVQFFASISDSMTIQISRIWSLNANFNRSYPHKVCAIIFNIESFIVNIEQIQFLTILKAYILSIN